MRLVDQFADGEDEPAPGILMVLESAFPVLGGGGAEHQVKNLAHHFLNAGIGVQVLVPHGVMPGESPRELVEGIPVERLAYPKMRYVSGLVLALQLAHWLIRNRAAYMAIHAHIAGNMAAVCCIFGRLLGKTVTVKYTGFTDVEGRAADAAFFANIRTSALRWATWIQSTSRRIAQGLERNGFAEEQIRLIPNAVDLGRFSRSEEVRRATRARLGIADGQLAVIYSGRLDPVKGIDTLIKAWEMAFADREGVCLIVVGRGREEFQDRMRGETAGFRSGRHILFLGAQRRVEDMMAASDLAVLPSLYEGLSNSLLEFMAAGLPVIGTRVSGTEDLVEHGLNGWMCEPGDATGLSETLAAAVSVDSDARLRMGQSARRRVETYAGIERIAPLLAGLYGIPYAPIDLQIQMTESRKCVA